MPDLHLIEEPTWAVQDASKIQTYMACPRRYFFEYVLGWRPSGSNVHLEFGTAWHLGMEVFYSQGMTNSDVADAFLAFETHYRRHFDSTWDQGNSPKNPGCAMRAFQLYADYYSSLDLFEVLHIEVAGSVSIAPNKSVYFKMDTIGHGPEGYFSLEHKTSGNYSLSWAAQWRLKMQCGVYSHVLYCLYPSDEIYGIKINGAFIKSEPKLKKDGTPYANSSDTNFHRVPVRRNTASMNSWLAEVNMWYDAIIDDFQRLSSQTESEDVLQCFPRNTENCTKYGACPFLDYCAVWHNPMQHAEAPPVGFAIDHWDPRSMEYIKETIEL